MSKRDRIAQYIAQHFLGADCENAALKHADSILKVSPNGDIAECSRTPTEKRIEVVQLLQQLRQDGETTGDVFLRGLRALKALPEVERIRGEWCNEYVALRDAPPALSPQETDANG